MTLSLRLTLSTCLVLGLTPVLASSAWASLDISSGKTKNVHCSAGVCTATANDAVLSVHDLETLLTSKAVKVATGTATDDIRVDAALTWASSNSLTLDAQRSLTVNRSIFVAGLGGLTLTTEDGGASGALSFGALGSVSFLGPSNPLSINGTTCTLVKSIAQLAEAVNKNPGGSYALAGNYNAQHIFYRKSPIGTTFAGKFQGLGNTIVSLSIRDRRKNQSVGLFSMVGTTGKVENLRLVGAYVRGNYSTIVDASNIGALAGVNAGSLKNDTASGTLHGRSVRTSQNEYDTAIGGLVGQNSAGGVIRNASFSGIASGTTEATVGGIAGSNYGLIVNSNSSGDVRGGTLSIDGGLVGVNFGVIETSFSSSAVRAPQGSAEIGGLVGFVGFTNATIINSYSTGSSTSSGGDRLGGLVGENYEGQIQEVYSTGYVKGENFVQCLGGLVGDDESKRGSLVSTYWDTDTSGVSNLGGGSGCPFSNDPGITGLTTAQFQSGLPAGFDPKIWAEKPNINGGLPYLRNNPPPK